MNAKLLSLLFIGCLPLGGCLANASTPPSQEIIERAVRAVEVIDQYQQRRGAAFIEYDGKQWWVAVAGQSDKGREPERLMSTRLTHLARSSIAIAALKENPYCAEFRDLTVTPMKKDDGFWVVYAVVRADHVRKGTSCTPSSSEDAAAPDEIGDPLDAVIPDYISLPKQE